jgi:RimJ/RimL family protein N-acetyltransferase
VSFPRELLTDRLRLRQWEDRDLDRLAWIYTDPGYLEHMPAMDREATASQVARFRERWEKDGFSHWAVEERVTETLVGRIGLLCHRDWPLEVAPVEVGWTLAPEARGRGFATEGGRASLEAAFAHLDVARVISITTTGIRRSVLAWYSPAWFRRRRRRWQAPPAVAVEHVRRLRR